MRIRGLSLTIRGAAVTHQAIRTSRGQRGSGPDSPASESFHSLGRRHCPFMGDCFPGEPDACSLWWPLLALDALSGSVACG